MEDKSLGKYPTQVDMPMTDSISVVHSPYTSGDFDGEKFLSLLSKYAWIACAVVAVLSTMMYFLFPRTATGNLDRNLGVVQEINGRGSAQGNCEMPDTTVATVFRIEPSLVRSFYIGAICRWVVLSGLPAEVSYAWFESGSLAREKEVNQQLGFTVQNISFDGRSAILVRSRPEPGCGIVTDFFTHGSKIGGGVIQFWIQSSAEKLDKDYCVYAQELMHIAFGEMQ